MIGLLRWKTVANCKKGEGWLQWRCTATWARVGARQLILGERESDGVEMPQGTAARRVFIIEISDFYRSLSGQGRLDPPSEAGRDYLAGLGLAAIRRGSLQVCQQNFDDFFAPCTLANYLSCFGVSK